MQDIVEMTRLLGKVRRCPHPHTHVLYLREIYTMRITQLLSCSGAQRVTAAKVLSHQEETILFSA